MKKQFLNIIFIIGIVFMILPFYVHAESYSEAENIMKNYLDKNEFKNNYNKYLYTNGTNRLAGMISKKEVDITRYDKKLNYRNINYSYLWNSKPFWSNEVNIPIRNNYELLPNDDNVVGTRVTLFIDNETGVYGSGTYNDPWLFSPQYKVHIKVNDMSKGYITNKNNSRNLNDRKEVEEFIYIAGSGTHKIYVNSIGSNEYLGSTCGYVVNGINANGKLEGTEELGGYILISDITRDTECFLNFGERPRKIKLDESYNDNNPDSKLEKNVLYMLPERGWYEDEFGNYQIVQITKNPKRMGYNYEGYYFSSNKDNACSGDLIIDKNKTLNKEKNILNKLEHNTTLYACYKPITYYIAYNCPNGTPKANNEKVEHIYNVPKRLESDRCTRTGYDLATWNTKENGTGDSYGKNEEVLGIYDIHGETLNLYSQWTPKTNIKYVVKHHIQNVNDNNYTLKETVTNENGTADAPKTINPNTYVGFTSPSSQTVTIKADGSTVVDFYYTRNSYTITFNANGHGTPDDSSLKTKYGATYNLTTISADGYIFNGWYTEAENGTKITSSTVLEKAENHTLYAHWTLESFDVTFDPTGGSATNPTKKTVNYSQAYGELPSTTRTGYAFDGWYTEKSGGTKITSTSIVTQTSAHTLYAHWSALTQLTATFKANGSSTTETTKSCYIQPGNTSCTVTAPSITASTNYTLVGWNTSSSATSSQVASGASVTLSANTTYYAIQKRTIKIKFNANAATINSTEKTCTMYNTATSCNITTPKITADTGYEVVGFNTSNTGTTATWNSETQVSVSASNTSNTYYAIQKKTITITFNKNGASGVTKTSDSCIMYNSSTSCKIKTADITVATNWSKIGWNTSSSATTSSYNVNTEYSFSSSSTLYAITRYSTSTYKTATFQVVDSNGTTRTSLTSTYSNNYGNIYKTVKCYRYNGSSSEYKCTSPSQIKVYARAEFGESLFDFGGWSTTTTSQSKVFGANEVFTITSDKTYYQISKLKSVYYSSSVFGSSLGTNFRSSLSGSTFEGLNLGHRLQPSSWRFYTGESSCYNYIWIYGRSLNEGWSGYGCSWYLGLQSRVISIIKGVFIKTKLYDKSGYVNIPLFYLI